jgi:adenylate kinase family enzyme
MRILITGASGSGTSTIGLAVAARLGCAHLDADDFYWLPTTPPFKTKRDTVDRLSLILDALSKTPSAVVSGSVMSWGPELEDSFSLIVFLTVPTAVRIERLRKREVARFGRADPDFLEWAAQYDEGTLQGRSLAKHQQWLAGRSCRILRLDGSVAVAQATEEVLQALLGK